jgi:hypothetical protein
MPDRHVIVAVVGTLLLLLTTRTAAAQIHEPLGTDCATQRENDARVRALFGPLLKRYVTTVGKPVGCLADAPDGGLTQQTTAGLLYARPEGGGPVRIVAFTDGHRHWAVDANLSRVTLYWEGEPPYPPAQGVTRLPVSAEDAQAETPWPPTPAPTVGHAAPAPASASRPATGDNLAEPTFSGGHGELVFSNDLPVDVAFKMRDADGAKATRAFVYVRAGEQTTLQGVNPGTYLFQGIAGIDWEREARVFRRVVMIFKADETVDFVETKTDEGIRWMTRTVSIYPLTDGSDGTLDPIDLSEFQAD